MILNFLGKKDDMVEYVDTEPWTTGNKKVDVSLAIENLQYAPEIGLQEEIAQIADWMRRIYADNRR